MPDMLVRNQEHGFMITRRTLCAAASAFVASRLPVARAAQSTSKQADFMFVQSARSMTFNSSVSALTLGGVSPITFFFSDRPERIAGNMRTASFVPFWSKGKDSFLSDPAQRRVSVFIDIIGMPLTPLSYAGVRRRAYRRAWMY